MTRVGSNGSGGSKSAEQLSPVEASSCLHLAQSIEHDLIHWRRDFHIHPELAFNEHRSAGIIAEHLRSLGYAVETGIAGTGVVGTLQGLPGGRKLILRFDMDALRITETTGKPYASQQEGVMHACGHDGHMAIGMGVARLVAEAPADFPGTVVFLFQPAEEGEGGAERMLETGILERLQPDAAVALHLWNELPIETLAVTPGPVMAGADRFVIVLRGEGGHAALPQRAADPVPAAAAMIQALQTIPAREVDPRETLVLGVSMVHGGTAFNVIPDRVELEGTLRYFSRNIREVVLKRIQSIVDGIAAAYGISAEFELQAVAPPVTNQAELAAVIKHVTQAVFPGFECLDGYRVMGSEDMAFFLERVPGCYLFLGSNNADRGLTATHHSPDFDFDERALVIGTAWLLAITRRYLVPS
jgi:amidohydrolase